MWALNLCKKEKEKLKNGYGDEKIFEHMQFYPGFNRIEELMAAGIDVFFNSNCGSERIKELKYEQIKAAINIPDNHIILNVMDIGIHHGKEIGEDVDFFVDDNPYHIAESNAKINFMPLQPWNRDGQDAEKFSGKTVIACKDFHDIIGQILEKANSMEYEDDLKELKKKADTWKSVPRHFGQFNKLLSEYQNFLSELEGKYHMEATDLRMAAGI